MSRPGAGECGKHVKCPVVGASEVSGLGSWIWMGFHAAWGADGALSGPGVGAGDEGSGSDSASDWGASCSPSCGSRSHLRGSASAWPAATCWSANIWTRPSVFTMQITCWADMTRPGRLWGFRPHGNQLPMLIVPRSCGLKPNGTGRLKKEKRTKKERMKDCYCYLGLHFILLDDSSQSYILKLRDRYQRKHRGSAAKVDAPYELDWME